MKLPEPKQLPSGAWRVQVMIEGKRVGKTFDTKEDALYWAAGIKTRSVEDSRAGNRITLERAAERYVENKSAILSPTTIRGYKMIADHRFASINKLRLCDISQEKVQRWVNGMVKEGMSPKTINNAHGLLSAILKEFDNGRALTTTLPQKQKQEVRIPSEADLKTIAQAAKGTKYELPVLMAIWLGMRQSEITGLRWENVRDGRIHVVAAKVYDGEGWVEKGTKTTSGTRSIRCPKYILDLIAAQPKTTEYVIPLTNHAIYDAFRALCKREGLPPYRFHDLRHANASVMLAERIPDKYSQKRMGHATTNMLKTVYQHTFKEREEQYDDIIDQHMEELLTGNQPGFRVQSRVQNALFVLHTACYRKYTKLPI